MSSSGFDAPLCMVSICAVLAMETVRSDNFQMWRDALRDVLTVCHDVPAALRPLKESALELTLAQDAQSQILAMTRLRIDCHGYFIKSAAYRLDAYNRSKYGVK